MWVEVDARGAPGPDTRAEELAAAVSEGLGAAVIGLDSRGRAGSGYARVTDATPGPKGAQVVWQTVDREASQAALNRLAPPLAGGGDCLHISGLAHTDATVSRAGR